jgi:hypothetical protein
MGHILTIILTKIVTFHIRVYRANVKSEAEELEEG